MFCSSKNLYYKLNYKALLSKIKLTQLVRHEFPIYAGSKWVIKHGPFIPIKACVHQLQCRVRH